MEDVWVGGDVVEFDGFSFNDRGRRRELWNTKDKEKHESVMFT